MWVMAMSNSPIINNSNMRIYNVFNHQERGCHVYPPNSQIDPAMLYGDVGGGKHGDLTLDKAMKNGLMGLSNKMEFLLQFPQDFQTNPCRRCRR